MNTSNIPVFHSIFCQHSHPAHNSLPVSTTNNTSTPILRNANKIQQIKHPKKPLKLVHDQPISNKNSDGYDQILTDIKICNVQQFRKKRAKRFSWTHSLQLLFQEIYEKLTNEYPYTAYASKIAHIMNQRMPALNISREIVASHLQKHRKKLAHTKHTQVPKQKEIRGPFQTEPLPVFTQFNASDDFNSSNTSKSFSHDDYQLANDSSSSSVDFFTDFQNFENSPNSPLF